MTSSTPDVAATVAELREQAGSDHVRGCMGRQYSCDCGFDLRTEGLLEQAADLLEHLEAERQNQAKALSEAEAEIERIKIDCAQTSNSYLSRALAAEAHLAEAMKVIEPFGLLATRHDELRMTGECHSWIEFLTDFYWPSEGHCVAARSFLNAQEKA